MHVISSHARYLSAWLITLDTWTTFARTRVNRMQLLKYLSTLNRAKQILWCYLIWYLTMSTLYFDSSIHIWLTSLGVSAVIGIALILSVSNGSSSRPDFWTTIRLFLMPFCVSSFSALVKGQGFILVLSPRWREDVLAALSCLAFLCLVHSLKWTRHSTAEPASPQS